MQTRLTWQIHDTHHIAYLAQTIGDLHTTRSTITTCKSRKLVINSHDVHDQPKLGYGAWQPSPVTVAELSSVQRILVYLATWYTIHAE